MAPAGLDADDLDSIPLSKRRAMLPPKKLSPPPKKLSPSPKKLSPSPPASSVVCALPAVRAVDKAVKREGVSLADLREWPGLPRGVKFDPSDEEFLWHLLAKVGKGEAVPHPLISEFIISLDEDDSFHYTHPQRLAGVKQDGSVSYFFQRRFKAFNSKNKKRQKIQISETEDVFWHTIGNTEAVFIDGVHRGCKKMMVLNVKNDEKPEVTNWVMHQYHVGRGDDGEGDFVACKIFYDQYPKKCDTNTQSLGPKIDAENQNVDLISVEASNQDGSLRLPVDLVGNKKEYVNEKVLADQYPADIQLPFEEPTHSPSSTITGSSDAAAQSPSCSLGCQNPVPSELVNSLENEGTCHVKEEGNANCLCEMNTSFEANCLCEMNTSFECTAGMLASRDKGFEEASFTGTLLSCPDYVVSQVNKAQESNDQNCYQAHASELQPSNVRARVINLNDVTKLSGSTHTIVQMEVKTEHLDEGYAIAVKETAAELPQSDSIDMLDSVSSTVPVVAKTELLREKYTKNVPGPIGVKFYNTSVSGYPAENLFSAIQCSIVLDNCAFSHPTSQSNHEHWNPNVAELSSSKVLDSGSINMSDNSCLLSQFSESAGDCQDKRLLIRSKLPGDTFGLESYPEGVRFDALSKLPNANCSVKVKFEPVEVKEELDKLRTEVKEEFLDRPSTDVLDHIPLKDRIEMAFSNSISKLDFGDSLESSQNNVGHTSSHGSPNLNPKTRGVSLRRRRKRTATDSVEAALEEDAPGLLQVLLDKGITVEEIKLYGDNEDGEPLEIYSDDDSFEELKTVMNKLFLEPSSLLKFSKSRHEKGPKAVYCLACLISLIEQTRYLRFRNSPVEWGWCRDLQSFIFVFEKHNRIVLERPEYGYATYFFELVDSVSADWQTKRLMTALKLTSCSRTTLIENRPLMVGKDLSEGEARVLEEYGWTPNTGLGTMLNYCDRVVHDKTNESYSSDWRAKIGRLLIDGHDAGRTMLAKLPKKALKCVSYQSSDVKFEF